MRHLFLAYYINLLLYILLKEQIKALTTFRLTLLLSLEPVKKTGYNLLEFVYKLKYNIYINIST